MGKQKLYIRPTIEIISDIEICAGGGKNFIGTSNVYLAMKYNLPCIGTMSHQIISALWL